MIIVTGAYGFIGSCLIGFLNKKGISDIIAVDDFSKKHKEPNLVGKHILQRVERTIFMDWFAKNASSVDFVFHLGARTDTTEFDYSVFETLNIGYSQAVFNICQAHHIPFIYASSAATYGEGEWGYNDSPQILAFDLKPLNPYGRSKNEFDKWVLNQVDIGQFTENNAEYPTNLSLPRSDQTFWAGLKFFNVYGPNEYHKGRMASTIFHFFHQINEKGLVKLFKSHREGIADGEQQRDFIYVEDVLSILWYLFERHKTVKSGLYNVGTGTARSFNDLVKAVFNALQKPERIEYIPIPADIRATYQYFTQANMTRLLTEGYHAPFYSLEAGIEAYLDKYLIQKKYF